MQLGFVKQESTVIAQGDQRKEVKYLVMSIKPTFGPRESFTLSKNNSDKENAPAYHIYAHSPKNWIGRKNKVGALWLRKTEEGENFMSGHIETPLVESGRMSIALWKAKPMYENERVDWLYDVSWKPYRKKEEESEGGYTHDGVPVTVAPQGTIPTIDIDDDEIPF